MTIHFIPQKTKHQIVCLIVLVFGLNLNTLWNDYAVDDVIVMTQNKYVEKGIAGIPDILTNHLFSGYSGSGPALSEKRYRPVAQITYAMEHQFCGNNPLVSHSINVLLFVILIFVLYKLLHEHIFKNQHPDLAFIVCLIFTVHPIHSEVIANVKSRDELICFLMVLLSLYYFAKYENKKTWKFLALAISAFFVALLSRESATTFIIGLPLFIYFFFNKNLKKALWYAIPLICAFVVYFIIRHLIIQGNQQTAALDILNSPFMNDSATQAFASKIVILCKYLFVLIFPFQLSSDYGYNQIPYVQLISASFIASLLLLVGLIAFAIFPFKRKSLISFSILYFFVSISLASNLVVDIGTPFSERLLFQASLAFCIVLAYFYLEARKRLKLAPDLILLLVLSLFSFKTFCRNSEWKNNETLYSHDIQTSPNSLRLNLFWVESNLKSAGAESNLEKRKEDFKKAIEFANHSLELQPKNIDATKYLVNGYCGLLLCYPSVDLFLKDNQLENSSTSSNESIESLSKFFYKQGNGLFEQNKLEEAVFCFKKSVELSPNNVESWYSLGGTYLRMKNVSAAKDAWDRVKVLNPNHVLDENDF